MSQSFDSSGTTRLWAAGGYSNAFGDRPLLMYWSGKKWIITKPPTVSEAALGHVAPPALGLVGNPVATAAGAKPWAVGIHGIASPLTLSYHWTGTKWVRVNPPNPGSGDDWLNAVAETGTADAWSVGTSYADTLQVTLVLHWNGSAWSQSTSPTPGDGTTADLWAVQAQSATSAWAVGDDSAGGNLDTLALRWDGLDWVTSATPNPDSNNALFSVAATSSANAWAVGYSCPSSCEIAPFESPSGVADVLILRWDGSTWKVA